MEINEKLAELEKLVNLHSKEIEILKTALKIKPPTITTTTDEFESLKTLLASDQWPEAIKPYLACDATLEQDKEDRAEGILDLIVDTHLEKLAFLDFGCGEGHVVTRALVQNPRIAIGYDIVNSDKWKKGLFTTSWDEVRKHAPYNVILLYDVLDHIEGDDITVIGTLKRIKAVMSPNAKAFVRCHPWCSRHATHVHHQINKAFVHLVFTPEELNKLGYKGVPTRPIIHPMLTYLSWFQQAGLKLNRKETITKSEIENFFHQNPLISKRIKTHWQSSVEKDLREGKKFPPQLEFQFLDFVLN